MKSNKRIARSLVPQSGIKWIPELISIAADPIIFQWENTNKNMRKKWSARLLRNYNLILINFPKFQKRKFFAMLVRCQHRCITLFFGVVSMKKKLNNQSNNNNQLCYQARPNGFFHINYDSINTVINKINDFLSNLAASTFISVCVCVLCVCAAKTKLRIHGCHKVVLINEFDVKCDTGR